MVAKITTSESLNLFWFDSFEFIVFTGFIERCFFLAG